MGFYSTFSFGIFAIDVFVVEILAKARSLWVVV